MKIPLVILLLPLSMSFDLIKGLVTGFGGAVKSTLTPSLTSPVKIATAPIIIPLKTVLGGGKGLINGLGKGSSRIWRFAGNGRNQIKLIQSADQITGFSTKVMKTSLPIFSVL